MAMDSAERDMMIAGADGKALRVILLQAESGSLHFLMQKFVDAAVDLGVDHLVISEEELAEKPILDWMSQGDGPCVAISMNQVGYGLTSERQLFWHKYGIPFYDIMLDHPRNYEKICRYPIPELHPVVVDRNHVRYLNAFYPQVGEVLFLPLGGSFPMEAYVPYEERKYDVIYTAGAHHVEEFPVISFLSDQGEDYYRTVMNRLLEDSDRTTESVAEEWILEYQEKSGQELTAEECILLIGGGPANRCEVNVRGIIQDNVLKTLAHNGIHVDIFGGGWKQEEYEAYPCLHFHGQVAPEECPELCRDARMMLNLQPWFKDGAHDRIFNAMLGGAVALTEWTPYLDETFEMGRDIIFFHPGDPQNLADNVKYLLDRPQEALAVAEGGRQKAEEKHTWENRFLELLTMIKRGYVNRNFE